MVLNEAFGHGNTIVQEKCWCINVGWSMRKLRVIQGRTQCSNMDAWNLIQQSKRPMAKLNKSTFFVENKDCQIR